MKFNWSKIGMVSIIIAPVIIGGYLIYTQYQKSSGYNAPIPKPQPPKINTSTPAGQATNNSNFPLKVGSNNDYVKQLQDELGVKIDGIFGQQTLSALQAQMNGKSSITDYNDLVATCTTIDNNDNAPDVVSTNASDAQTFLNNFKANYWFLGGFIPTQDMVIRQVTDNGDGTYTYTFIVMNWQQGETYLFSQYAPLAVMQDGTLVVQSTVNGSNVLYSVDLTKIQH